MGNGIERTFLLLAFYIGIPAGIVWDWVRWAKRPTWRTVCSAFSLLGFSLATVSALLAASSIVYANAIGGFPYYDPAFSVRNRLRSRRNLATRPAAMAYPGMQLGDSFFLVHCGDGRVASPQAYYLGRTPREAETCLAYWRAWARIEGSSRVSMRR